MLQQIVFWLFGSLLKGNGTSVSVSGVILLICLPGIARDVPALRRRTFLLTTAMSFTGTIGVVSPIARHIARVRVGEDQRFALNAAGLILMSPSVPGKLSSPGAVMPMGIITALVDVTWQREGSLDDAVPALHRGSTYILQLMALNFAADGMIGIRGPNGSAKSALPRAMAGLARERVDLRRDGGPLPRERVSLLPRAFAIRSFLSVLVCVLPGQRRRPGVRVPPALIVPAQALLKGLAPADLADRLMNRLPAGSRKGP